jgi:hypothetical protein
MREALLLKGLNSGKPVDGTGEFWHEKRCQLIKRYRNIKGS